MFNFMKKLLKADSLPLNESGKVNPVYDWHVYAVKDHLTGTFSTPIVLNSDKQASALEKVVKLNNDVFYYVCSFCSDDGSVVFPEQGSVIVPSVEVKDVK